MPLPTISPPLINSSNPWATTLSDLEALFECPYTGAVTTRTSLLHGFDHDDNVHQYTFFNAHNNALTPPDAKAGKATSPPDASLNTLGYSPIPLATYLAVIAEIVFHSTTPLRETKPWIVSVTGSAEAVRESYRRIVHAQKPLCNPLCMEVNLSCPNIPGKPPPAYSRESLEEYLSALAPVRAQSSVPVGIKTPPFTYHDQFQVLIDALLRTSETQCPIDFITATNTLGSSLLLSDDHGADGNPAINSPSGLGIGGMAGAPLHPLALGNVKTLRFMLDQHEELKGIDIIGVGGVSDRAGFERMRAVGAKVVGVGTALGRDGVDVFESISKE
ncbi:hypothetical protein Q7P37_001203 [Cladosporium fusiforme]